MVNTFMSTLEKKIQIKQPWLLTLEILQLQSRENGTLKPPRFNVELIIRECISDLFLILYINPTYARNISKFLDLQTDASNIKLDWQDAFKPSILLPTINIWLISFTQVVYDKTKDIVAFNIKFVVNVKITHIKWLHDKSISPHLQLCSDPNSWTFNNVKAANALKAAVDAGCTADYVQIESNTIILNFLMKF